MANRPVVKRIKRENRRLQLVRIGLMRVSSVAQRERRQSRIDDLTQKFDLDKMNTPEVSFRDGYYYIMDGQHRIEALKAWLGVGWEEQHVECWVAEGLTEQDEAEIFLALNDKLNVGAFDKFKVAVLAGRPDESSITRIVEGLDLKVAKKKSTPGAVSAVGALMRVYKRNGPETLERALRLSRDAYGAPGMDGTVIDGFALLCNRYNGTLNDAASAAVLAKVHGGLNGLLGQAEVLHKRTGNRRPECIAAAAVEIINHARPRGGMKRLPGWYKISGEEGLEGHVGAIAGDAQ